MANWSELYNDGPSFNDMLMMQRQAEARQMAEVQAMVERERQMKALNSPFIQQMMGGMMAQPGANERPSFGPGMPNALGAADQITPRYPSAMGVDMPPGAARGSPSPRITPGSGSPFNSQAGVQPGGEDPRVEFTMGDLQRTPMPPSGVRYEGGRPVIEIDGANWVDDQPKQPEKKLQGGRIGERPLNLRQPIPKKEQKPEQMTPEQFALFQQMSPQLTQRRVAQEQAASAEDRKYAELDMKNQQSQMRQGYDIWKTSVEVATKLKLAEQKLRAKANAPGAPKMLRDLVPAMANIRGMLEGESNRIQTMLGLGYGVSQNPQEKAALQQAQMRVQQLMQSADAITMQYTGLFNQTYDTTVPTLKPTQPIPQAPPGQGRQVSPPAPGGLTPAAQRFLQQHG